MPTRIRLQDFRTISTRNGAEGAIFRKILFFLNLFQKYSEYGFLDHFEHKYFISGGQKVIFPSERTK